jgi:hypothetical protein
MENPKMELCSVHGCDNRIHCKTLCAKHYQRIRKHEDIGVNYKHRMNRTLINDRSSYLPSLTTTYEKQALREMFFRGKHHGGLEINYNFAIAID